MDINSKQSDNPPFPANLAGSIVGQTGSSSGDTAACMDRTGCGTDPSGNRLQWEPIFPQGHLSTGQGFIGQRVCSFIGSQSQLDDALAIIGASHWPRPQAWCKDCLPIDIQWGAAEKAVSLGNIPDASISTMLESFTQYRIAVVYQLLHISDPWPITGKPSHPTDSVMTLQVRGGGELLLVDPTAFHGGAGKNISACFTGRELAATDASAVVARMRVPLTEYHITCDRLTDTQLCMIMHKMPWKCREMTVNCSKFMNEAEGTLLFDSWTLDQTFVPDINDPRRWRLGCVLKCRQVPGMGGPYPDNCDGNDYPIGWNHDFKRNDKDGKLGWRFIMMQADLNWTAQAASTPHDSCPRPMVPRYQYVDFTDMFCGGTTDSGSDVPVCTTEQIPDFYCNNSCPDSGMGCDTLFTDTNEPSIRPQQTRTTDDYAVTEAKINEIVEEARKARARSLLRTQQRAEQGEIEVWQEPFTPKTIDDKEALEYAKELNRKALERRS